MEENQAVYPSCSWRARRKGEGGTEIILEEIKLKVSSNLQWLKEAYQTPNGRNKIRLKAHQNQISENI